MKTNSVCKIVKKLRNDTFVLSTKSWQSAGMERWRFYCSSVRRGTETYLYVPGHHTNGQDITLNRVASSTALLNRRSAHSHAVKKSSYLHESTYPWRGSHGGTDKQRRPQTTWCGHGSSDKRLGIPPVAETTCWRCWPARTIPVLDATAILRSSSQLHFWTLSTWSSTKIQFNNSQHMISHTHAWTTFT